METNQQNNTAQDHPQWISKDKFEELITKDPITLCEIDSLSQPGKKFEYLIKPPSELCYAASMRYMTNTATNKNDVVAMAKEFYSFCFVAGEPELMKELNDESYKARHIFIIGTYIGEAFPMPETKQKKTYGKR